MDARLLSFKVLLEYKRSDRWLKNIRNDHFSKVKPTTIIAKRTIVLTNEVVKWQRLLDNIIDDIIDIEEYKIKINKIPMTNVGKDIPMRDMLKKTRESHEFLFKPV